MIPVIVSFPKLRDKLFFSDNISEEFNGSLRNQILHIWDIIDDHTLTEIFEKYDPPKYLTFDSASFYESTLGIPLYTVDMWIAAELNIFKKEMPDCLDLQNLQTTHTANFQINKKQINRFLAIKFCEIFEIDVDYTWSGIGKTFDLQHVLEEQHNIKDLVINKYWSDILSPISKFERKWIPRTTTTDLQKVDGPTRNMGNTAGVWKNGLRDIVSSSAVSLITESVWNQKAITFSEKTVYAMMGLTFPIWIGGYRAAAEWKNKGFDIFEDIIDHSYECMSTLIERCFYAFYLNRNILTNFELAKRLREENMSRLLSNQQKITSEHIEAYNRDIIKSWPIELQDPILESFYRHLPGLNK